MHFFDILYYLREIPTMSLFNIHFEKLRNHTESGGKIFGLIDWSVGLRVPLMEVVPPTKNIYKCKTEQITRQNVRSVCIVLLFIKKDDSHIQTR